MLLSAAFRTKTDTFTNEEVLVRDLKSLLGHPVLIRFFRVFQHRLQTSCSTLQWLYRLCMKDRGRLRGNIL